MRRFIKIISRYIPDDIVTYKKYIGKPYYEIMYEENGGVFVGFGAFNIDFISEWIIKYFIDNKIDNVLEIIDEIDDQQVIKFGIMAYGDGKDELRQRILALKGGEQG